LTRNISRRLERLETRAALANKDRSIRRIICFVDMDRRVTSTLAWVNGEQVWTHFDTPREYAEIRAEGVAAADRK
jgi:hypothetical protein